MKCVELNGFIIDEDMYETLSKHRWRTDKDGYAIYSEYCIETKKRTSPKMHRIIMDAKKGQIVDHINGNVADNRRENLRFVTTSQSIWNTAKRTGCSSKYKGVYFTKMKHKYKGKVYTYDRWRVQLSANKKQVFSGTYKTELEAAQAYDEAAKKYHGEYAKLNFRNEG